METENTSSKSVAIIGAGPSGLAAIKSCVEQGLEPTCYELLDNIGGTWHYTEEHQPNQGASVYASVSTNSARELSHFSDFFFHEDCPTFVPHSHFARYLQAYAAHFELNKYVNLKHLVTSVEPAPDHDQSGEWEVHVTNNDTGESQVLIFSRVIVCSGYHRLPYQPDVPGLDEFQGEKLHVVKYRRVDIFKDKTVLIVGNALFAGDIATDAAKTAKQVYLSIGDNGAWLMRMTTKGGVPLEYPFSTRLPNNLHSAVYNAKSARKNLCESMLDQRRYGLGSDGLPFLNAATMFNEEMPVMLMSGRVLIKPLLTSLTQRGANFSDDSKIDEVDVVLFATGFQPDLSPIKCPDLKGPKMQHCNLFRWTFPINAVHPTLAFVGLLKSIGAHLPLFEMQARWATLVFAGKHSLPDKKTMTKELDERVKFITTHGGGREWVSNWQFEDEIAKDIGVLPSVWHLLLKSPKLAYRFLFGPGLPIYFRIVGPGCLPDAIERCHVAYHRAYHSPDYTKAVPPSIQE